MVQFTKANSVANIISLKKNKCTSSHSGYLDQHYIYSIYDNGKYVQAWQHYFCKRYILAN